MGYYDDKVQHILDTVLTAVDQDPGKRFVWEETSFFSLWWQRRDAATHGKWQAAVDRGQIEHIGSGWVMHDEACSSAESAYNQMTVGLQWLNATLGTRPRHMWHIDPFGHSVLSPTLMSQLGYSTATLNRIPNPLKQTLKAMQQLEFLWRGSPSLPDSDTALLAHVLDSHYSSPPVQGSTAKEQAASLLATINERAAWYRTDHILIPWGNDFAYTTPSLFTQMDAIMAYLAQNPPSGGRTVTLRYSTLSEYFDAVAATNTSFPVYDHKDLYPYIACEVPSATNCTPGTPTGSPDAFWSAYYTSKPAQKIASRRQDAGLRVAEVASALTGLAAFGGATPGELLVARNTSALMDHHDAITGTSWTQCTISKTQCDCYDDYSARIGAAKAGTDAVTTAVVGGALARGSTTGTAASSGPTLTTDAAAALAALAGAADGSVLPVVVTNALAWTRDELVRIAVNATTPTSFPPAGKAVTVAGPDGSAVQSQVVWCPVRQQATLWFRASLAPLQTATFFVALHTATDAQTPTPTPTPIPASSHAPVQRQRSLPRPAAGGSLSNGVLALLFSPTGALSGWRNESAPTSAAATAATDAAHAHARATQQQQPLSHAFQRYADRLPTSSNIFTGSNVYSWTPAGPPTDAGAAVFNVTSEGPVVWEATAQVAPFIVHTLRLFAPAAGDTPGALAFESQTRIGPLPENVPNASASFVSRWAAGVACGGAFTTDSNGAQRMGRTTGVSAYVQGNTYPVVGSIGVAGTGASLSLSSSRPMAGTVDSTCALGVMLHRRLFDKDQRGNDTAVVDDPVTLLLGDGGTELERRRSVEAVALAHPPSVAFGGVAASKAAWVAKAAVTWSPWQAALPSGVHLATLQPLPQAHALTLAQTQTLAQATTAGPLRVGFRLQLLPGFTQPVSVDLDSLVAPPLSLSGVEETSADFQLPVASARARKTVWRTDGTPIGADGTTDRHGSTEGGARAEGRGLGERASPTSVVIAPATIRSFTATLVTAA